jgi:CRISPR-associated protein Cmr6
VSRLHTADVHLKDFEANAHPGLWLDRFCPEAAIGKGEEHGDGQRQHLRDVCGLKPASTDYSRLLKRHLAGCAAIGFATQKLPLTLRWRMAIHLSRASALENAATCLHPIYGFAYLPGSGLKGLARTYQWH